MCATSITSLAMALLASSHSVDIRGCSHGGSCHCGLGNRAPVHARDHLTEGVQRRRIRNAIQMARFCWSRRWPRTRGWRRGGRQNRGSGRQGQFQAEARIGADSETARTISLSSGSVDWQHTSFEASVVLRTLHPMWPLSIDAGLALGWATLEGQGYSPDRQVRSFEYGACAAIRLARNLNRWALWAEVRTYGWAQEQRASLTGEIATTVLPRVDVTADVGLSVPLVW